MFWGICENEQKPFIHALRVKFTPPLLCSRELGLRLGNVPDPGIQRRKSELNLRFGNFPDRGIQLSGTLKILRNSALGEPQALLSAPAPTEASNMGTRT